MKLHGVASLISATRLRRDALAEVAGRRFLSLHFLFKDLTQYQE